MSSLRALSSLVKTCRDRIPAWRKTILDAVSRCWVHGLENPGRQFVFLISDRQSDRNPLRAANNPTIRLGLLEVISSLSVACPSILQVRPTTPFRHGNSPEAISKDEIPRLRGSYPALGDIFPDAQTSSATEHTPDGDTNDVHGESV